MIGLKHYHSLRVLWKVNEKVLPDAKVLGSWKDDPIYRTASDYLNKSQSWQDYLANVSSGPVSISANRVRDLGAFSNVLTTNCMSSLFNPLHRLIMVWT